jgi:hypothetical protein
MAKNQPKAPQAARMSKPKTPAQREKTEANILAAQERLALRQQIQADAKVARAKGFKGRSDEEVLANQAAALQAAIDQQRDDTMNAFNQVVLTKCGKYSTIIKAWLATRVNREPAFVYAKINEFLQRERNAEAAAYVGAVLKHLNTATPVAA